MPKMFKISGRDVSKLLTSLARKIARTYKGEIERTHLGAVLKFPASFLTLGFDAELTGPRSELVVIEQLLLGQDTFPLVVEGVRDYDYSGTFSATSVELQDLSDSKEKMSKLVFSVVSTDQQIGNHSGGKFSIKSGSTTYVQGYFGQEVSVPVAARNMQVIDPVTQERGGILPAKLVLTGDVWVS